MGFAKMHTKVATFILTFLAVTFMLVTTLQAFSFANIDRFERLERWLDDGQDTLYIEFTYEMYFNDVDRDTLFEFMKEIQNDDLWCNCSETTVVFDGFGHKEVGRTWEQNYSFAGLEDFISYTRVFLKEDRQHSWFGVGQFADIVADYKYSDLDNGGTLLTFDAVYKPNVPATEQQITFILETLRQSYEDDFIGYFGSTGNVDLSTLNFYYL